MQDIPSSKKIHLWNVYVALISKKYLKTYENGCNLKGDTMTLNGDSSGIIHRIKLKLGMISNKDQKLSQTKIYFKVVL